MMQVFAAVLGQIAVSVLFVFFVVSQNYWAGLAALAVVVVIKLFYKKIIHSATHKKITEALFSITDTTVTFIVISSFGYAGIVHWGIIAPLLLTTYLVGYMGLRIGIATGKSAPRATIVESIFLPLCLTIILLIVIFYPDTRIAEWTMTNCIGLILLICFFALAINRARLAYTSLRTVKP